VDFTQQFVIHERPLDQVNETTLDVKSSMIGDVVPLLEDGEKLLIDDINKYDFIRLCIEYYSYKSISPYLDVLKSEFQKVPITYQLVGQASPDLRLRRTRNHHQRPPIH
jgi:hypothetical protein